MKTVATAGIAVLALALACTDVEPPESRLVGVSPSFDLVDDCRLAIAAIVTELEKADPVKVTFADELDGVDPDRQRQSLIDKANAAISKLTPPKVNVSRALQKVQDIRDKVVDWKDAGRVKLGKTSKQPKISDGAITVDVFVGVIGAAITACGG